MNRKIDMTDRANVLRGVELARASTSPTGWHRARREDLDKLLDRIPDEGLWVVREDKPEEWNCVAITGDGPTSEANAEFFVDARAIVLGLFDEIERLRGQVEEPRDGDPKDGCTGRLTHSEFERRPVHDR